MKGNIWDPQSSLSHSWWFHGFEVLNQCNAKKNWYINNPKYEIVHLVFNIKFCILKNGLHRFVG